VELLVASAKTHPFTDEYWAEKRPSGWSRHLNGELDEGAHALGAIPRLSQGHRSAAA